MVTITLVYIGMILLANWWWHPAVPVYTAPRQSAMIGALQKNLAENMSYGLPEETAALLRGIMLGEKTYISKEIKDMFSDTGVMHILAVSGLNVGMVAIIFFFIFTKLFCLKRKLASLLLIFVLVLFARVTGLQASVNRAVVMAIVGLVAVILERDRDLVNSIFLAALLLLLYDPRNLFNVGFQLSFAATLGIILFTPKLLEMMRPLGKIAGGSLAVTLGAQLAVTPLLMYYFHKVSFISPLANLAVVPLVGVVTGMGFASYFLRLLFAPLGNVIIQVNHYLLFLMMAIVRFFDGFPYAFVYVTAPGALAMVLYYSALWWWRAEQRHKYLAYGLAGLFMVNVGAQQFINRPLTVSFIDVGQGDSILAQLPDRAAVLIDGGGSMDPERGIADRKVAPYLWDQGVKTIDTVILTHAHYNHLQGLLTLLDKFKVRQVIMPVMGAEALRQDYLREFLAKVRDKKIYLREWRGGEMLRFHQDLRLESMPGDKQCIVTKLVYKNRSFLCASDGAIPVNEKADVAQLPNHGKDLPGTLPQAQYLVVSSRVRPVDEKIWSTKRDGTICFTTNGNYLKVKTSR